MRSIAPKRRSMDDPLFSDVFTSYDADEPSKNSNSNIFSMPVYDTPVYEEDIFYELPEPPKNSNNNILSFPVYDKPVYVKDIFYDVVDTIKFGVNVVDLGVVVGGTTENGYRKVIEEEVRLESVGSATENGDGIEKDVVTKEIGVDLQNSESAAEEKGYDDHNFDEFEGNDAGVFASAEYEDLDKKVDVVWETIDNRMDSWRKDRKEARLKDEIEKYRASNSKITELFADLRRKLHTMSIEEQREGVMDELRNVNLNEFFIEAVAMICDAKLKAADIQYPLHICSLLHQWYKEFAPSLVLGLLKVFMLEKSVEDLDGDKYSRTKSGVP